MTYIIVFIIALILNYFNPVWAGALLIVADLVFPDPMPTADELGLVVGLALKVVS